MANNILTDNSIYFTNICDILEQKESVELPIMYKILSLFNGKYRYALPIELWGIIGELYKDLLYKEITCRLRRFSKRKFSLEQSNNNLILRTSNKKLYRVANKVFHDEVHTITTYEKGRWLCKNKHMLVEPNEFPEYSEEDRKIIEKNRLTMEKGKCYCSQYYGTYRKCGYVTIPNYFMIFVDFLSCGA